MKNLPVLLVPRVGKLITRQLLIVVAAGFLFDILSNKSQIYLCHTISPDLRNVKQSVMIE